MKWANEIVVLWYMACCTYIVLSSNDSMVYIAFIGLHVFVAGLYKLMHEREVRHDKKIPGESV